MIGNASAAPLKRQLARETSARLESERIAASAVSDLSASIVDLKQASSLVTLLQRVAVAANEATTVEDAVRVALAAVCEHTGWPIGHLYLTDEPEHLYPTTIWHVDDPDRVRNFVAVTETTPFTKGVGLPGRVMATGRPSWIVDVHDDANFPRAQAARAIEVVAAFGFPILVGSEVVGVLEFFAYQAMETDDALLSVVANVGAQLGRVVERTRAEEALRRNEQWTREILETANDAFISIDEGGRIVDWNRQAERQFGWTREEATGRALADLIIPPAQREAHIRGIERYLATGEGPVIGRRVELEAVRRDGTQFPIELTPWAVETGNTVRFNAFIHDITERKAFERELEHQSLHDPLTGLPNRALVLDRLDQALDRARRSESRLALLFLDLDKFKNVNDSFGHEAGDHVLLAVAERVPQALRSGDTLARLSGDEFVVLCEEVGDASDAAEIADRILGVLAPAIPVAGSEVFISASIGIALTTGVKSSAHLSAEDVLADADLAMYRAKERGRGVYEMFDTGLRERVLERLASERALRSGILNSELVAHYQPLFDLGSGRVSGVEALVRWRHPRRGLLMPSEFIAMAEDSALISRLTEWMLRESCRQMRTWRDELADPPRRVGVNLSVRDLEQPGLVEMIGELLTEYALPPSHLIIEITESAVMHDAQAVIQRLWQLRDLGVRLAIDDFGIGFSSLDRLRRMPVESLKVDRSFIADMDATKGGIALVDAIIAMSHSLGLSVVAEGVETHEQLTELRRLGCDEGQGFLFARPAPADEIEPLLRAGRLPVRHADQQGPDGL